jgi:hypothetical protein
MSGFLEYLWQLPEKPEDLEPLGKPALPVTRSPWQQAEADAALASGDLSVVRAFARSMGAPVGVDAKFLDQLEKASAESDLDADEKGWLSKLFAHARQA